MANDNYGYRYGKRLLVKYPVDASTSDIVEGDMLILGDGTTGTAGYVLQASAGDLCFGFAAEGVSSPSTDGDVSILVDVSDQSVYEFAPDAGSVTQAIVGLTCDVGGARTINIDASTDDCILIRSVDTAANTLRISKVRSEAGVV